MPDHIMAGTGMAGRNAGAPELGRDDYHRLVLRKDDGTWGPVKPVRAFPLSAPDSCVFLIDADGREAGMVSDVNLLPPASREALHQTLTVDYLSTRVLSIQSVKSRHGVSTWQLQTERGSRTVHVKDRSDIRKLPGNRVLMTDVDGMRFEVPDTAALDDRSQGLLESET